MSKIKVTDIDASGIDNAKYLRGDGTWNTPPGGGGSVNVEDEGSVVVSGASSINFTGSGVTVTDGGGGEAVVNIPGGGGGGGGMTLISEFTATGAESTVTFSSIPDTYRALRLMTFARSTGSGNDVGISLRFNNDSSNIYDWRQLFNGSLVTGDNANAARIQQIAAGAVTSGVFDSGILDIFGYNRTVGTKSAQWMCSNSEGANYRNLTGSFRWRNAAAVNRIDLFLLSTNYVAGSYFALYGY